MDVVEIEEEISQGKRFEFGKNWTAFLSMLNEERISIAKNSLKEMLQTESLEGKTFLDIGSGSGLFSLSARMLGATVTSFDYDPASVACAQTLRNKYFPGDNSWTIHHGSVLDPEFLKGLQTFNIVYSWGVLHHTGEMWQAFENVIPTVGKEGSLFIAIYNDEGSKSEFWLKVKKIYCSSAVGKLAVCSLFFPYYTLQAMITSFTKKRNVFSEYRKNRGMSITHDWHDWLGGLPFEVGSVEKIRTFFEARGFELANLKTINGAGNNEFVFRRVSS
ncbi:MAG: class I SAM-dependent methyltransferase [Pyrinomonadaceae bacterium]